MGIVRVEFYWSYATHIAGKIKGLFVYSFGIGILLRIIATGTFSNQCFNV